MLGEINPAIRHMKICHLQDRVGGKTRVLLGLGRFGAPNEGWPQVWITSNANKFTDPDAREVDDRHGTDKVTGMSIRRGRPCWKLLNAMLFQLRSMRIS
jgi:hypothetical protein